MKPVAVVMFDNNTVDPFAGPATTFLTTVPIPPVWLLLITSLSACILNGFLNYLLARASDVALLRTKVAVVDPKANHSIFDSHSPPMSGVMQPYEPVQNDSIVDGLTPTSRYGTIGSSPPDSAGEVGLKASRAYERHVAFAAAARRHWRKLHPNRPHGDDDDHSSANLFKETDALLTNDQLHFPASSTPLGHMHQGGSADDLDPVPPLIYVTPTTNLAQSFAMHGGAAPPVGVEAVVAAANLQSTLRELRLEAQYVMFDTNRFFLISSTVKCLCMVVFLHYSLNIPGGWKRFTVASGIALLVGLLTPLVELLCAALLPNDAEVEDARTRRLLQEENDKTEKADTVLVVELVLRYCTYDFKDLTTVFIQNSVFVLIGTVLVPPLVGFCFVAFFAYAWMFLLPIGALYVIRRRYYREITKPELNESTGNVNVRLQGLLELSKCVLLKSAIIFLCIWGIQATFILAMATKEGRSYWDAVHLLWDVQFKEAMGSYFHQIAAPSRSVFWRIAVVSQLLF